MTAEDRVWLLERARAAGFDLAGLAAVPEDAEERGEELAARYAAWIADGRAGGMEYLKRLDEEGVLLRASVRRAFPWARSVLVAAVEYGAAGMVRSINAAPKDRGWIARYAVSGRRAEESLTASDYHDVLLPRLKAMEAEVRERFGPEVETRCYVDTGPLVERAVAAWAGVGWIGKNTCVLNEERGSWLLLGVMVTSLELEPEAWTVPAADRCGSCTRCIDACPTDALVAPRQMDASRCIAYLTIEHKGVIDEGLRVGMGRQVFGCDICQDVCPWNARRERAGGGEGAGEMQVREELVNPQLEWLAGMDNRAFREAFRGSPLERTGRKRVQRNVAIAMGNSGEASFVPRLEAWADGSDAVLAESAAWALRRLRGETEL